VSNSDEWEQRRLPRNSSYTVMVVPDRTAAVRRYRVPKRLVQVVLGVAASVLLVAGGATVHYFAILSDASEARALRDENLQLRSELRLVQDKMTRVSGSLERVERLDAKLRMMTRLNDPQRNLAIGPLGPDDRDLASPAPPVARPAAAASADADTGIDLPELGDGPAKTTDAQLELLHARLDNLAVKAHREETSLRELREYFQDQKTLLSAMPSIWPAHGWVTSGFGTRVDPFTGERSMHEGLDIASQEGTKVHAPADGSVVYAGLHGGYGNVVVIDHGFGVNTRYGHLSEIYVKVGQKVHRGQIIGAIGNTGRSTGPHLHYEVRVNGIPVDPRKFILN
jgi:murein DD-endopeptidase MepM/ murein hydrolase activator NlpD